MNKLSSGINHLIPSNPMKLTFIFLCLFLCLISFTLYSSTTFNWTLVISLLGSNGTYRSYLINTSASSPITSNRRFAIFGCSIHSKVEAYTFYTPITASSWNRVGYEAIVVFVGDFTEKNVLTSRLNLSRNYLKHVGAHVIDVQCNASYATKVSQLVRIFAGFLPNSIVGDDDNILTGDSDLMPLRPREYLPMNGTDGFVFNAFCCGSFKRREKTYRMFPMGHIYLKKKIWRAIVMESQQRTELLNTSHPRQDLLQANASLSFDLISIYARHEFKQIYDGRMTKGDSAWYMDQVLCSMLIWDYRAKHPDLKINERSRPARLDRGNGIAYWNRDKFDQFGDAHLIHDSILQEQNWKIFNKLLKALFNQTLVNLFNDYYRQYIIAKK